MTNRSRDARQSAVPGGSEDDVEPAVPGLHQGLRIEPHSGGVSKLTLIRDRLEDAPTTARSVGGAGWMFVLSGLKTFLETGAPRVG